jgi:hypothetical protein
MLPPVSFRNVPSELRWDTETVTRGEAVEGCIVGPAVEANTHFVGHLGRRPADRACRAWATGGVIFCEHCQQNMRKLTRGYLPLMTKLREKLIIVMSETVLKQVRELRIGTPVRFARPKKGNKPLVVTLLKEWDVGEDFAKKCRQLHPFDVFPAVLHLWQYKELNEFFKIDYYPAMTLDPEPGTVEKPGAA